MDFEVIEQEWYVMPHFKALKEFKTSTLTTWTPLFLYVAPNKMQGHF